MNEELRQTGRTAGLMLEALGKAVRNRGELVVFEDHGDAPERWDAVRVKLDRLRKMAEALDLCDIDIEMEDTHIHITSRFRLEER